MASDPSKLEACSGAPLLVARSASLGSLLNFFLLTYAVSWTWWLVVAALSGSASAAAPAVYQLLFLPGVFAPALTAVALTAKAEGSAGVRALLARLFQWQVGKRWFVFAVGYIFAIKLTVALLHRVVAGAWPQFGDTPWYIMAAGIMISTPVQSGEEIGWRGYALPRLGMRFGLASASVLLGLVWACWHLPLFFIPGTNTYGQSFPVYALQVIAVSVAIAWLYAQTNGSLLLTMLMHAAVNNSRIIVLAMPGATNVLGLSAPLLAWLMVAVLWVCAAYFLVRMPPLRARRAAQQGLQ